MNTMRRRDSRGFTLLEVMVTVSIALIVLAIGIPNFVRLRAPYALSGATRQIAADLDAARQRAIARNTRYRVTFNALTQSYTIERENAGAFVPDSAPQPLPRGAQLGTVTASGTSTVARSVLGTTTTN